MSETFMIETDAVTNVAQSLSPLVSELSDLSNSVSGYDVANADGFDFEGPKGIIAATIATCSTKVSNTVSVLNTVVSEHDSVQNSTKFEEPESAKARMVNGLEIQNNNSSNGTQKRVTSYNGGGTIYYDVGGSTSSVSTPINTSSTSTVTSGTSKSFDDSNTDSDNDGAIEKVIVDSGDSEDSEVQKAETQKSEAQKKEVEPVVIKDVGYAYVVSDKMSDESSKLIKDKVNYDNDGYAKIGDRYVVSCDPSIGKVGDVLRFTKEDGTVTELVVGVNTKSSKYKNRINFLIDKDSSSNLHAKEVSKNLLINNKSIENYGNIDEYGKKVTTITNTLTSVTSDGNDSIMDEKLVGDLKDTLLSNGTTVTDNMQSIIDNDDNNK